MNYSTLDTFRFAVCSYDSTDAGGPSDACLTDTQCKDIVDTQTLLNRGFVGRQARNNIVLPLQDSPCTTLDAGRRMVAFAAFDTDTTLSGGLSRLANRLSRKSGRSTQPFDIMDELRDLYAQAEIGHNFSESMPVNCNVFDCARTLVPVFGQTLIDQLDDALAKCSEK